MKRNYFILLILIGLTLRLILALLPGFKIDVDDWFSWALRLQEVGFSNFYSDNVFTDYPPGYLYILSLLAFVKSLFQLSSEQFYLLLKLPAIIADTALAYLIYKELKKTFNEKISIITSLLVLFNPAFIFNSSIWGQIDSLFTLTLFLSIYFLKNNRLKLASLLLGLTFLIKPQAIAVFPIFLAYFLKLRDLKKMLHISLPFIFILLILSIPFFLQNPLFGLINKVAQAADQYAYTSLFAYNFWGVIGFWLNDQTTWLNLSFKLWGYILFGSYLILLLALYFKKRISIYSFAALATLAFYFLPTRVHERYLYPSLVFLILLIPYLKNKLFIFLVLALNLIHFLNLYYVYIYYNHFYFHLENPLYLSTVYNFLDLNGKFLSIISTLTFTVVTILIIIKNSNEKILKA